MWYRKLVVVEVLVARECSRALRSSDLLYVHMPRACFACRPGRLRSLDCLPSMPVECKVARAADSGRLLRESKDSAMSRKAQLPLSPQRHAENAAIKAIVTDRDVCVASLNMVQSAVPTILVRGTPRSIRKRHVPRPHPFPRLRELPSCTRRSYRRPWGMFVVGSSCPGRCGDARCPFGKRC